MSEPAVAGARHIHDRLSLSGRRALITGAARGFGLATATDFVALGATVAMLDLSTDAVRGRADELGALAVAADVSDPDEVRTAWAEVERELGGIDILVNNAGIASAVPFLSLTREEWDRVRAVNVDSLFNLCSLAVPGMVDRGFGRVINVASIAGLRGGGNLGRIAYATSKAAVIGFTKALARECAAAGVTCNAIAPGGMDTEMTKALAEDPEVLERVLASIPLGYRGSIQDISGCIAFLASDLAAYVTGETLIVDGGVVMQ